MVWALAATGLGGVGLLLAVLLGLMPPPNSNSSLGIAFFGMSFLGGGPLVLGLSIAGATEPRPLPRGVVWIAAGAAAIASGVALTIGLGVDNGVGEGVAGGLMCCGTPAVVLLGAGIWSTIKAFRDLDNDLETLAEGEVVDLLNVRSAITFDELASIVGLHPDRIAPLLTRINHKIGGELVLEARAWVSAAVARTGRTQMLGMIEAQGKVTEQDLSKTLGVPESVVRVWVYDLAGTGQFEGSVHWPDVWSAATARLGMGSCPNCGGTMAPAGRNRLQCGSCGSEGFA